MGLFIQIMSSYIPEKALLHIAPQSGMARVDSIILPFNKSLSQPHSLTNASDLLIPRQGWRQGMRVQVGYLVCHSSSKGKIDWNGGLQGWGLQDNQIGEELSLAVVTEKTHKAFQSALYRGWGSRLDEISTPDSQQLRLNLGGIDLPVYLWHHPGCQWLLEVECCQVTSQLKIIHGVMGLDIVNIWYPVLC